VGLSVYPSIVATQRLGKHVPTATKYCWRRRFVCFYQRKEVINSFPNFLITFILREMHIELVGKPEGKRPLVRPINVEG
jgi:hypothetical protein